MGVVRWGGCLLGFSVKGPSKVVIRLSIPFTPHNDWGFHGRACQVQVHILFLMRSTWEKSKWDLLFLPNIFLHDWDLMSTVKKSESQTYLNKSLISFVFLEAPLDKSWAESSSNCTTDGVFTTYLQGHQPFFWWRCEPGRLSCTSRESPVENDGQSEAQRTVTFCSRHEFVDSLRTERDSIPLGLWLA